ncbi:YihY/virulence factor BrkB family protein [Taklimakanibacter deserti]|uniref:YihY/virulence factor BrkB family protein n=1 Tax=Taklimakanibacter deserti TaxID=2267839 RepID=UPI000E64FE71
MDSRSGTSWKTRATGARPSWPGLLGPHAWWALLKDAGSGWLAHGMSTQGAALAFYSLFALGPVMLISISIAGLVFGAEAVRGQVSVQLASLVGEQGARVIESLLAGAGRPREGLLTGLVGVAAMLIAAVTVVVQLKDALNLVWSAEAKPASGVLGFIRKYAVSLAGVLAMGFLLLVSLLITALLSAMGEALSGYFPEALFQLVSLCVSLLVTTLLFAMMFRFLPDIDVLWRDVLPGAFITALLFELGKFLIGVYIGKQGLESTYGAAASLVVVLIWVYYSAQLVLFGAEITRAYAERRSAS